MKSYKCVDLLSGFSLKKQMCHWCINWGCRWKYEMFNSTVTVFFSLQSSETRWSWVLCQGSSPDALQQRLRCTTQVECRGGFQQSEYMESCCAQSVFNQCGRIWRWSTLISHLWWSCTVVHCQLKLSHSCHVIINTLVVSVTGMNF